MDEIKIKSQPNLESRTSRERLLALAKRKAVFTPKDAIACGIERSMLPRLENEGILYRVQRGSYMLVDRQPSERETLLEAFARPHKGVVALLSALNFHGVTTQLPSKLWMAVPQGFREPSFPNIKVEIVRISPISYEFGIEKYVIEGVEIKVYSLAKTIADLFKFRRKVGLDVAIEALKESINSNSVSANALYKAAEVCRITTVMKPYMEAIYAN